jgi:hypothetical protein
VTLDNEIAVIMIIIIKEYLKVNNSSTRSDITNKISCNKNITNRNSKRRLCQQFAETVEHTIPACPILAKGQYLKRRDRVCAQLHFNICKEIRVKLDKEHWYEHVPELVETSPEGKVAILWNKQVQTHRTIPNNKPDIIIHDNEKGICMLIGVAIAGDRNVIEKEAEKILKYKDFTTEIQRCGM